jgi:hypothetical protein
MCVGTFADRLRELQGERTGRNFAQFLGLPPSTFQALVRGGAPTLDTLVAIVDKTGVCVEWLAKGSGPKFPQPVAPVSPSSSLGRADPELFGRVVDRVARVYREEAVRLSDIDLGRIAAERYAEIVDLAGDPDEWPALLELIGTRIRRAIRAAAADPTNVKREA